MNDALDDATFRVLEASHRTFADFWIRARLLTPNERAAAFSACVSSFVRTNNMTEAQGRGPGRIGQPVV